MQYRSDRQGNPISILGYGCLRFTKAGKQVLLEKAEKEVLSGIEAGINYFDTAYTYGGSEKALGEILARNHVRDKVRIATKLPGYLMTSEANVERCFMEQLARLQTDHVEYYLMHMLTDVGAWERLEALGIADWMQRQRDTGRIGQVGFSFHGDTETFQKLLHVYDWDLCQIQYNYLDEHTQAGRKGLLAAHEKGLPVIIMEPLRGGRLVEALPREAKELLAARNCSPAALGLRWLYDQEAVTCVLSGMNDLAMVQENARIADTARVGGLTQEDRELVDQVRSLILAKTKVPCTGCSYCMPCPHGVDIPQAFRSYNAMYLERREGARFEYCRNVGLRERNALVTACIGCGACEKHCPQHIQIRQELRKAKAALLPWPYQLGTKVARTIVNGSWRKRK